MGRKDHIKLKYQEYPRW